MGGMKENRKPRKILVLLYLSYCSRREILYGISRYARQHCRWRFHIVDLASATALDELRRAEAEGVDGIITQGLESDDISTFLRKSRIPLAVVDGLTERLGNRTSALAFVQIDNIAIGRAAADYLTSLGRFRSYGFVGRSVDAPGSMHPLRKKGFCDALAAKSAETHIYQTVAGIARGSFADISALADWLVALPKPTAVMASHDLRATHVLEAAQRAKLKVPQELAVVGVDNDELYCETSDPTITSIAPDHVRLGELTAGVLQTLMTKSRKLPTSLCSSANTIVERQSSKPIAPATLLIDRATAFIRQNATKGIRAMDVAEHLGISRRLANLRFRQLTGESILEAIQKRRFDEVKRRLRQTEATISKIIADSGFRTVSNAKSLFKKRFGLSMNDYRRHARLSRT